MEMMRNSDVIRGNFKVLWFCKLYLVVKIMQRSGALHCVIIISLQLFVKKGKGSPYNRPWGRKRGSRGIALPFRKPQHEKGMGWLASRPGRLNPGKETRYPFYRRLGGPQGRFGRLRKISPPPGFDPRTVQPVASRYTDCAMAAHYSYL
jgi:hypothetical protein